MHRQGQRRTENMADGITAIRKHDRFDVRLQQMVGWRKRWSDEGMETSFKEECNVWFRERRASDSESEWETERERERNKWIMMDKHERWVLGFIQAERKCVCLRWRDRGWGGKGERDREIKEIKRERERDRSIDVGRWGWEETPAAANALESIVLPSQEEGKTERSDTVKPRGGRRGEKEVKRENKERREEASPFLPPLSVSLILIIPHFDAVLFFFSFHCHFLFLVPDVRRHNPPEVSLSSFLILWFQGGFWK